MLIEYHVSGAQILSSVVQDANCVILGFIILSPSPQDTKGWKTTLSITLSRIGIEDENKKRIG